MLRSGIGSGIGDRGDRGSGEEDEFKDQPRLINFVGYLISAMRFGYFPKIKKSDLNVYIFTTRPSIKVLSMLFTLQLLISVLCKI